MPGQSLTPREASPSPSPKFSVSGTKVQRFDKSTKNSPRFVNLSDCSNQDKRKSTPKSTPSYRNQRPKPIVKIENPIAQVYQNKQTSRANSRLSSMNSNEPRSAGLNQDIYFGIGTKTPRRKTPRASVFQQAKKEPLIQYDDPESPDAIKQLKLPTVSRQHSEEGRSSINKSQRVAYGVGDNCYSPRIIDYDETQSPVKVKEPRSAKPKISPRQQNVLKLTILHQNTNIESDKHTRVKSPMTVMPVDKNIVDQINIQRKKVASPLQFLDGSATMTNKDERTASRLTNTNHDQEKMASYIGKIKVQRKTSNPLEQSIEEHEHLTSPSFALFEVEGTKRMIQKRVNNEMGTSPISHTRGGTAGNPPIIASKAQPSIRIMQPQDMVSHLESQLRSSQQELSKQLMFDSNKSTQPVPKVSIIDYSSAISNALVIHSSPRPYQVQIDETVKEMQNDLMKYSITQHHPPYKAVTKRNSDNLEEKVLIPDPEQPKLTVDEAIAMTASKVVNKKVLQAKVQIAKPVNKQMQDAFAGGTSVLSHLLKPIDPDIVSSQEKDISQEYTYPQDGSKTKNTPVLVPTPDEKFSLEHLGDSADQNNTRQMTREDMPGPIPDTKVSQQEVLNQDRLNIKVEPVVLLSKDTRQEDVLSDVNHNLKSSFSPLNSPKKEKLLPSMKPSDIHINVSPGRSDRVMKHINQFPINKDIALLEASLNHQRLNTRSGDLEINNLQKINSTERVQQEQMFENINMIEKTLSKGKRSPRSPKTTWRSPDPTTGSKHLNPNVIENYLIKQELKKNRKNVSYNGQPEKMEVKEKTQEQKIKDYENFKKQCLMQAHFNKLKMPFAHYDHPKHKKEQKKGKDKQNKSRSLSKEKKLLLLREVQAVLPQKEFHSIMPAPQQKPQEQFQNRLIQKRISEEVYTLKERKSTSLEERSQNNPQSIKEELMDIEIQLKNLQEVYTKNQEVLRQIKVHKTRKFGSGPSSKRSNDSPALRAKEISLSHKKMAAQEKIIQLQQEELQYALLQSQMKNLQIQQKLKQKSELQASILEKVKASSISPKKLQVNPNIPTIEHEIPNISSGIRVPKSLSKPIIQQFHSSPKSSQTAEKLTKKQQEQLKLNLNKVQVSQNMNMLKYLYTNLNFAQQVIKNGASMLNSSERISPLTNYKLPYSIYDQPQNGRQIFQNAHIAEGVIKHKTGKTPAASHRTASPRGDYQVKTDASPGLQSSWKKANQDLAMEGVEEAESERDSAKKRVERLQKKHISRNQSGEDSIVEPIPARDLDQAYIGVESHGIMTHSAASDKQVTIRRSQGNLFIGQKTIDGDQSPTQSPMPRGVFGQYKQPTNRLDINYDNSNLNIQIGGSILHSQDETRSPHTGTLQASPKIDESVIFSGQQSLDTERLLNILKNNDGSPDMQKFHEAILGFSRQRIKESLSSFSSIAKNAKLSQDEQIAIAIQGTELLLRDIRNDQLSQQQRQQIIKKLEQSYIKVHTPRKDDFMRSSPANSRLKVRREMGVTTQNDLLAPLPIIRVKNDPPSGVLTLKNNGQNTQNSQEVVEALEMQLEMNNSIKSNLQTQTRNNNYYQDRFQSNTYTINSGEQSPQTININDHYDGKYEADKQMYNEYLTHYNDFKRQEAFLSYLNSQRGDEKYMQEIAKLILKQQKQIKPDVEKEDTNKLKRFTEKHFPLLKDDLYLTQPELCQKLLESDLYYKRKQQQSKQQYISHVQQKLQAKMDEIIQQHKTKQKQLVKNGGLFPDDILLPVEERAKEQEKQLQKEPKKYQVIKKMSETTLNQSMNKGMKFIQEKTQNGFDMSVQKLQQVVNDTHQDSILSTDRKPLKKYFHQRSKSNAVTTRKQISIIDQNNHYIDTGLIKRDSIKNGHILNFNIKNPIRKSEITDVQGNQKLQDLKKVFKEGKSLNKDQTFGQFSDNQTSITLQDYVVNTEVLNQQTDRSKMIPSALMECHTDYNPSISKNTHYEKRPSANTGYVTHRLRPLKEISVASVTKQVDNISLSVSRVSKPPEKEQEKQYMKFINNQTAVLPALKEIVDKKTADEHANSKSHFQYDLLLDRMNRTMDCHSRVAGGMDSSAKTCSTLRYMNDQALMHGVTVKNNYSNRKASVQNHKSSSVEFTNNLRKAVGRQKRQTILDLEKIPKGYKNLENDLILSQIDGKTTGLIRADGSEQLITYTEAEGSLYSQTQVPKTASSYVANKRPSKIKITQKKQRFDGYKQLDNTLLGDYINRNKQNLTKYKLPSLPEDFGVKPLSNLKLKIKDHLTQFEPIQAKDFITQPPRIRDFKMESERILGEQFRPEVIKANEEKMRAIANQEEQEVKQFFKSNVF